MRYEMEDLLKKCRDFLDGVANVFTREFEDKYCGGQIFESYAEESPESFVKDVLSFSLMNMDSSLLQSSANRHIGKEAVRRELLAEISERKSEFAESNHRSPKKQPEFRKKSAYFNGNAATEPSEPNRTEPKKASGTVRMNSVINRKSTAKVSEPNDPEECEPGVAYSPSKKGTHGKLYAPHTPHTDAELKSSIDFRLFTRPHSHDRYTRLSKEEIRYILLNTGLSSSERTVFLEKCDKEYLPYKIIAHRLGCSESRVKQIASRVDRLIRRMLYQK